MAIAKLVRPENQDLYHGVPVLVLHVDDPIPTPRAPVRYAIRVTPDLARYFLTFNHPENRGAKKRKVAQYAGDMSANRWQFTPESLVFSVTPILENGQQRLRAITEAGVSVWLMVDFGWPDGIITTIDRGAARTNSDSFTVSGISNGAVLSGVVTKVWQYDRTVGQTRTWSGYPAPSSAEALALVNADAERFQEATQVAGRLYHALDHGAGASTWGAAFYLIARERDEDARRFFDEVIEGSGEPRSATRSLADWFRRRPVTDTQTGDNREPIELIIRAFNAWTLGKMYAKPKYAAFTLSRVRPA